VPAELRLLLEDDDVAATAADQLAGDGEADDAATYDEDVGAIREHARSIPGRSAERGPNAPALRRTATGEA
jgi:hypothetical protein